MTYHDPKDRYYSRNVFGISSVEFTWGLGLPVVVESTFLQLFIKSLGASSFAIGLIPAFFFIGSSIFALVSSYYTSQMLFRRGIVVGLHIVSGLSLLAFGIILYLLDNISFILFVFFTSYAIFSFCIGMTLPVWLNYLVDILSEEKSVSGIAFMLIAQNIAKLIGSVVIVKLVDSYAFSIESSAFIFIAVGLLFTLGSLFFFITIEFPDVDESKPKERPSFFHYSKSAATHLFKNRNFLKFMAGDFEFFVIITVISFYANYATTYCGVDPAIAAGFFVSCIYGGAISANFLLGTLGIFQLKQKYLFSKLLSFSAIVLLLFFSHTWIFFIVSFLLGFSRGTRMVSYAPTVKMLSGLNDSTSYFAISPIIMLPFTTSLPMLSGKFLDTFSYLEGDSYRIVFGICAGLILFSLYVITKTEFKENAKEELRV